MTDTVHTIVALALMFMSHVWGYHRAMQKERVEGMKEVLSYMKEIGIINNFVLQEVEETEEKEGSEE